MGGDNSFFYIRMWSQINETTAVYSSGKCFSTQTKASSAATFLLVLLYKKKMNIVFDALASGIFISGVFPHLLSQLISIMVQNQTDYNHIRPATALCYDIQSQSSCAGLVGWLVVGEALHLCVYSIFFFPVRNISTTFFPLGIFRINKTTNNLFANVMKNN